MEDHTYATPQEKESLPPKKRKREKKAAWPAKPVMDAVVTPRLADPLPLCPLPLPLPLPLPVTTVASTDDDDDDDDLWKSMDIEK